MNENLGVLNVGAGDIKLSFSKDNMQERLRAARVVKDMLRRGSAILIEVDDGKGGKVFQRVHDFDEDVCEYIIADYVSEPPADQVPPTVGVFTNDAMGDSNDGQSSTTETTTAAAGKKRRKLKTVPAERTRGVAVARSAGG